MTGRGTVGPDTALALHDYIMNAGSVIAVEVDLTGTILQVSEGFRWHFKGEAAAPGARLWRFLVPQQGNQDILAILPEGAPVPQVFGVTESDEHWLMYLYRLKDSVLLLGESVRDHDALIIQRMSQLSTQMSHLIRDMRQSYRRLSQTNEQNERLARVDPLTRLANRRYFLERLETAFQHARSRKQALSLLSVDLDHFKTVNDTEGHAAGDAALVMVADTIRAVLRLGDLAGRFGGEEFIVCLPDSDLSAACAVAERLRRAISECGRLRSGSVLTASIGVAELGSEASIEELLKVVDDRLYLAKSAGRDRVVADPD